MVGATATPVEVTVVEVMQRTRGLETPAVEVGQAVVGADGANGRGTLQPTRMSLTQRGLCTAHMRLRKKPLKTNRPPHPRELTNETDLTRKDDRNCLETNELQRSFAKVHEAVYEYFSPNGEKCSWSFQ